MNGKTLANPTKKNVGKLQRQPKSTKKVNNPKKALNRSSLEKSIEISSLKKRYRIFYDELPGLLRTIDTEGIILDCNKEYAETFGYSKNELIGKSVFDFLAKEGIQAFKDSFETWVKTGKVKNKPVWFQKRDGSKFLGLVSANNLYDEDGKMIGSNTVIKDITEIHVAKMKLEDHQNEVKEQLMQLQKSNELLRTTEGKYRNLYEKTPVLLRTITVEGILTDCNEAYAKTLGYTKEEAVGVSFYEHTAQRSVEDLKSNLEQWRQTQQVSHMDIWMKRKDGSIFPALLTGTSLHDEQGNLIGRTVAITDMTEIYEARKLLEAKEARIREQYEELKKIDVSKEEFTSMISHELKTPLTPIMGWCQALKNPNIMGHLNPKQLQALDAILTNAVKLKDLVGDMLDAQKLDMKKMKFDHNDVDVTEMMTFMEKNLQSAMEPKHIEFVNSTKENLALKGDRSRLEQILNNIILNAVDFVPNEKGRIEMRAESKDSKILFTVKDNGIGIPKKKQDRLFTQFYQLDTSATRKHGGSGLGLSICKGIVAAMGGEIWLDSDEGKGATFYFTIPRVIETTSKIQEQNQFPTF